MGGLLPCCSEIVWVGSCRAVVMCCVLLDATQGDPTGNNGVFRLGKNGKCESSRDQYQRKTSTSAELSTLL